MLPGPELAPVVVVAAEGKNVAFSPTALVLNCVWYITFLVSAAYGRLIDSANWTTRPSLIWYLSGDTLYFVILDFMT